MRFFKNCNQRILQTAADASTILGVRLPDNRATIEDCNVQELRNFITARGGKISGRCADLLLSANAYQFIEEQVSKTYVDFNPNPSGSLYLDIKTSSTRSTSDILHDLNTNNDEFDSDT